MNEETVDFNGITQAAFLADITAAAADDATIGDLEAELKMKREVRWWAIGDKRSKVGLGARGSAAYGNDSPHNARVWASSANPTAPPA